MTSKGDIPTRLSEESKKIIEEIRRQRVKMDKDPWDRPKPPWRIIDGIFRHEHTRKFVIPDVIKADLPIDDKRKKKKDD